MKPTTQTQTGTENPRANCLMAAVASILEIEIDVLPDVFDYEERGFHWWKALMDALEPYGVVPLSWSVNPPEWPAIAPPGYHIAVGKSPRSEHPHAVVALDGKIVHDPHPSRAGIDGPITSWIVLMPRAAA